MKKTLWTSMLILISALILGYTAVEHLGKFTIISHQNIDLTRIEEMHIGDKLKSTNLNLKIFGIKTKKEVGYELERAIDSILDKIPGAVGLVNATLSYKKVKGITFEKSGYIFEGQVLIDPSIETKTSKNDATELYFIVDDEGNPIPVDEQTYMVAQKVPHSQL
ncbi:MAG: hypothetical protein P1P64_00265 [Treponemataceae bacterium]